MIPIDLLLGLIIAPVISVYSFRQAYPDWNTPTCQNYIRNTYLYTLSCIVILWMFICILSNIGILQKINFSGLSFGMLLALLIIYLIIIITLFVLLKYLDPRRTALKHSILLLIILIFSPVLAFSYNLYKPYLISALLAVILIGYLAYFFTMTYPQLITPMFNTISLYILIGLVIINFVGLFFIRDMTTLYYFLIGMSIAFLIAFTLRLLVYNKNIKDNSEKCNLENAYPDYTYESSRLFIVFINMIQDIARILFLRRNKKLFLRKK